MVGKDSERDKKPNLSFKTFDLVTNPSPDHHYLNTTLLCVPGGTNTSKFAKTIRKEWKILSSCLPETIFVRSYESRIDLVRAAIIGAEGTPYSNALFFFDIHLPPTYPEDPSKLFFHSHGLLLNPNLYSNGYVCLSILNTWHGLESEKWNPGSSTVLQVLLSIQALVLNTDPYYNEPLILHLYRIFGEQQRMSFAYSSVVFVSVCKLMCYELNKPPEEFKHLVETHFRMLANAILANFRAYCASDMILLRPRKRELFSKLVQAFEKNGACCREIVDEVKKDEERNGNYGWFWMFKSIWMKIINCFSVSS